MFKFLLILALFCYLIYRVGGFLFRMFFIGAQQSQQRNQYQGNYSNSQSRKAPDSNLNIDHIPHKDKKDPKDFKGGEYVDFEEVK